MLHWRSSQVAGCSCRPNVIVRRPRVSERVAGSLLEAEAWGTQTSPAAMATCAAPPMSMGPFQPCNLVRMQRVALARPALPANLPKQQFATSLNFPVTNGLALRIKRRELAEEEATEGGTGKKMKETLQQVAQGDWCGRCWRRIFCQSLAEFSA